MSIEEAIATDLTPFERAKADMDATVIYRTVDQTYLPAFDPWAHRQVADLLFIVLHEVDRVDEGEISLTRAQARAYRARCVAFLRYWRDVCEVPEERSLYASF